MSQNWWMAMQVFKRLWFRAALYGLIAVVTAGLGIAFGPLIPDSLSDMVGAKAVDGILSIIASSMLAVTTFSLSTLVAATTAAATSGTPRAISLLLQDRTAQSALSSFLGAFLFSLVGLIALSAGLYGGGGRLILFAATLGVIVLIVTMLLRWIDHLAGLGQVGETIRRVSDTTARALAELGREPCFGCKALSHVPEGAQPVFAQETGHIRHLDIGQLASLANKLECDLHIVQRPGSFTSASLPLLYFSGGSIPEKDRQEILQSLRRAFTIGDDRSFDQDPLFGLTVLSEIASRALSPGINDPGTAVDVVVAATRLLDSYGREHDDGASTEASTGGSPYDRLHLVPLSATQLVEAVFLPISRDGAGMLEVGLALQQAFSALAASPDAELAAAARMMAGTALERGLATLVFEDDRVRLRHARLASQD